MKEILGKEFLNEKIEIDFVNKEARDMFILDCINLGLPWETISTMSNKQDQINQTNLLEK